MVEALKIVGIIYFLFITVYIERMNKPIMLSLPQGSKGCIVAVAQSHNRVLILLSVSVLEILDFALCCNIQLKRHDRSMSCEI